MLLRTRLFPLVVNKNIQQKLIGPFLIVLKISLIEFILNLPNTYQLYSVVHMSHVRKYFPPISPTASPPEPLLIEGEDLYVVE